MNLNQVTIGATNVEVSTKFYQDLGLKLIVDALPNYVRFECPEGQSTFSIHQVDTLAVPGTSIYFEVDNLEQTFEQLTKKGITFISEPEEKPWLWKEAHLKDPSGNKIIIFHAGQHRKNPPWRIQ